MAELRRLQESLARRVRLMPLQRPPETVAGVDAAYGEGKIVAAAVLYDLVTLSPIEHAFVIDRPPLPYVPGFLSFREGPFLSEAVRRLSRRPDVIIVDGQGIAHPKRFVLACHLGIDLELPAIGSAKSRLLGEYIMPGQERGASVPLVHHNEAVGAVVRTRSRIKPLFVSPGHLITIDEAVALVLRTSDGFRLPEPQRAADRLATRVKQMMTPG